MSRKTVHIENFGCQMNKLDAQLVASAFEEAGFGLSQSVKDADVVLINTCSVRQNAEQRVISHLGHLKHIKESRPDIIVGVIGCMAQRLGEELFEHKAVDIVCGPAQIPKIVELATQAIKEKTKQLAVTEKIRKENQSEELEDFESAYGADGRGNSANAFVRVMRGCNNFCTYCIVPYVRGPEVSRPPKAIVEQVKHLACGGVKQVTLLGQTVNSYKYIAGEKTYCLADLFEMLSEIDGIEWLKFVTSYPSQEFFVPILKAMADLPKVCKYLHMPPQSGSDRILKAMNRKYTSAEYLDLLVKAREIVPDIAIAGDFIVGFPGETEDDFQCSISLLKKAEYKNSFIFKYSPRPDTAAEKRLADDVLPEVKKKRNIGLLAEQEKNSDKFSQKFFGKEVRVLVDGPSKKAKISSNEMGQLQLVGRTEQDCIVIFEGLRSLTGSFAKVKITRTSPLTLFGELI
ncbi:MAG: tRNA (N6-isopentenyl adenosine(37)-C2)-methylthiotransferase MiaB [Planctomycetes bacterium]|nr:tRNA (N6-isopentenyl adenosine(37)-C2)-methylthiotransferase MiaB [Planctomycetota bacterium]